MSVMMFAPVLKLLLETTEALNEHFPAAPEGLGFYVHFELRDLTADETSGSWSDELGTEWFFDVPSARDAQRRIVGLPEGAPTGALRSYIHTVTAFLNEHLPDAISAVGHYVHAELRQEITHTTIGTFSDEISGTDWYYDDPTGADLSGWS